MLSVSGVGSNNFDKFNLINEFSQKNGTSNCVPIAMIKASMDKYGKDMFRDTRSDGNGGYNVTLRSGGQVSVSKEELQRAKEGMDVNVKGNGNSDAMDQTALAYAVIAKRKAADERTSYDGALKNLKAGDGGEKYLDVAKWLGVEVKQVNPNQVGNADAAVLSTGKHALYVDDGQKVDSWGKEIGFNPEKYKEAYLLV